VYGGRESAETTEGMVMVSRGMSVRDIPFPLLDPTSGMVLDGGTRGNSHADERRLCSGLGSISKSLPESRRIENLVAFFRRLAMKSNARRMKASPNIDPRIAPTIVGTLLGGFFDAFSGKRLGLCFCLDSFGDYNKGFTLNRP